MPLDEKLTMGKLDAKELYLRMGKGSSEAGMSSNDDLDAGPAGGGGACEVFRALSASN